MQAWENEESPQRKKDWTAHLRADFCNARDLVLLERDKLLRRQKGIPHSSHCTAAQAHAVVLS